MKNTDLEKCKLVFELLESDSESAYNHRGKINETKEVNNEIVIKNFICAELLCVFVIKLQIHHSSNQCFVFFDISGIAIFAMTIIKVKNQQNFALKRQRNNEVAVTMKSITSTTII